MNSELHKIILRLKKTKKTIRISHKEFYSGFEPSQLQYIFGLRPLYGTIIMFCLKIHGASVPLHTCNMRQPGSL
uniref:Uncharacterized protein n=1 Tax=Anguilla anguilla TaxID=7936 RepID=A0A0E9R0V8_ANGAN